MVTCRAPGKAVIWGEYAVLAGAPALVMALNRYAICRMMPGGEDFRCLGRGFNGETVVPARAIDVERCEGLGVAAPVAAALKALDLRPPTGATVELDTHTFLATVADGSYRKLGIGSSAAICTATCAAVAALHEKPLTFEAALAAHRWMQNPRGSGIDVAASFYGGVQRFEAGTAAPATWPEPLHYRFFWSGSSASTASHLNRFADYLAAGELDALDRLALLCSELFESTDLDRLSAYVEALKQLDRDAGLGVFSEAHEHLHALAITHQVVYKPCGAGGGDIGVAFAEDNSKLNAFSEAAAALGLPPLSLEIAPHGIEPTR
jgi:phosphomevalonate kinase